MAWPHYLLTCVAMASAELDFFSQRESSTEKNTTSFLEDLECEVSSTENRVEGGGYEIAFTFAESNNT